MTSGAVGRASSSTHKSAAGWCLSACSLFGCGGGAALLHPAQTLPPNSLTVGAGVSGQFLSSGARESIDHGRSAAGQPLQEGTVANAYAEGVLTEALLSPGASPWVAARMGLPENLEAGLTYTGRSLRLDGRYALDIGDQWTLSLGLGATGLLLRPDRGAPTFDSSQAPASRPPAEFEPSAQGFGADLPVLVGYRLLEGFGDVWVGPRLGFEHLSGNLRLQPNDPASLRIDARGNRFWTALVAGFSLGIPPLWLRFELSTTYHRLSGSLEPEEPDTGLDFDAVETSGWTFSPSGAIVGKF